VRHLSQHLMLIACSIRCGVSLYVKENWSVPSGQPKYKMNDHEFKHVGLAGVMKVLSFTSNDEYV
jgi:hypothetical protein